MNRVSLTDFEALTADAVPLARNDLGVSVFRRADGRYIKVFRRRRLISSDRFRPYARRFVKAARGLAARGVRTIRVVDGFRVYGAGMAAVVYEGVEGDTLRRRLQPPDADGEGLLERAAHFFAQLHEKGIYFRSNHFDNIIVPRNGGAFGLIDVTETSFRRGPLPMGLRARNFKPPLRYESDRAALVRYGVDRFIDEYIVAAGLTSRDRDTFLAALRRQHEMLANL